MAAYKISEIDQRDLGKVVALREASSIEELAELMTKTNWAPATFSGDRRQIANAWALDLLVLDVDAACSLNEAKEIFREYKHIIGTTKNHQREKNGVICDRFRVALFLTESILNDRDYKATWREAHKTWPFIDKACKDISRFFAPCKEIVSIQEQGKLVEVVGSAESVNETIESIDDIDTSSKGILTNATLEFLAIGAEPGERHPKRWKAACNMREQGYTIDEVIELMSKTMDLDQNALRTIEDVFKKPMRHPKTEGTISRILPEGVVSAAELLDESFEYLANKDLVKGDSTGLEDLDKLLGGGFRTGELTVLMAQAKTGKNSFYHVLLHSMLQRGISVGYASRELSPSTEVLPNLLSINMQCNTWMADITEEFKAKATETIQNWPLFFAPGYGYFPLNELKQWFHDLKDLGVNHFFFDHLHYALAKEDYESVSSLIKELKALTKELDIHINLIVQPRSLREGESLSLATLRGGAAIGQALDNLLILERVRDQKNVSKLTLEVARHKLAEPGHLHLIYVPETTDFLIAEKAPSTNERVSAGQDPNGVQIEYDA